MKALLIAILLFTVNFGNISPKDINLEGTWLFCITKVKGQEIDTNACPSVVFIKGKANIFWSENKITSSFNYQVKGKKFIVSDATPECIIHDGTYTIREQSNTQFSLLSADETEYTLGHKQ